MIIEYLTSSSFIHFMLGISTCVSIARLIYKIK